MEKFVIYYRVSTKKQGQSGLGLKAQKRDINLYLTNYAQTPYEVIEEFTDIESGKNNNREQLALAIKTAKANKATLLVSKLDRLSRQVSFIATLIEDKKLDFTVASMPNADKFQLHIYAALAEQERDFISMRTKAALAEAKANGVVLGGLRDTTNQRNKMLKAQAQERAVDLASLVLPLRKQGMTLSAISEEFNKRGIPTARGGAWTATTVNRLIDRVS
jgi:DNA invertase Pin-like site-specific DNA recombinase